jgi:hypothetical protein
VLAVTDNGHFVLAWTAVGSDGTTDVFAQEFQSSGAAQAAPFVVNTSLAGNQTAPSIAIDDAGDFARSAALAAAPLAAPFSDRNISDLSAHKVDSVDDLLQLDPPNTAVI